MTSEITDGQTHFTNESKNYVFRKRIADSRRARGLSSRAYAFCARIISPSHLRCCHLLHVFYLSCPGPPCGQRSILIIYRFIQTLVNLVNRSHRTGLEVSFVCFVLMKPREGRGRAGAGPGAAPVEMGQNI